MGSLTIVLEPFMTAGDARFVLFLLLFAATALGVARWL